MTKITVDMIFGVIILIATSVLLLIEWRRKKAFEKRESNNLEKSWKI